MMLKTASVIGILGLFIATLLFAWQGFDVVLRLFASAGIGVIGASLFHGVSMLLNARAWQILLPAPRPSALFFTWAVWLREAVNGLLPVARIGGEVATARLLIRHGMPSRQAVASLVVDVTVSLGSQYLFTMLGLGLLLLEKSHAAPGWQIILGALIVLPLGALFWLVQQRGLFTLLAKIVKLLIGDRFSALVGDAALIDDSVRGIYARHGAIIGCGLWQVIGWLAGAGEIFLILVFMGHPIRYTDAVIIESLIQALSSGAFLVPGAIGVQEGGFVMIGGLIGLPADIALALALARRARDVLLFVPALVYEQIGIGQRVLKSRPE